MPIQILSHDAHVLNVRMRMPFRFGIATMTQCPHLFMRVELAVDGTRAWGWAADHLPPKWFTKSPQTPYRQDVADMLRVILHAAETAKGLPESSNPFALWEVLYEAQAAWGKDHGYPPLLSGFGTSLVERAMIDAFCRATGMTFEKALRKNAFEIEGVDLRLLPGRALRSVILRHTVGLVDPITESDIAPGERVDDGLPQSLDQCIRAYGLTHFKIKLCGDIARDTRRLISIAQTIERETTDYAFTLDGNENFKELAPFRALWEGLITDDRLKRFLSKLIFVEQPLHRDVALSDDVQREMRAWGTRPPMIIDESDSTLDALPRAIECGYVGTSHKNCKGVFRGVMSACRVAEMNALGKPAMLSGEDLCNIGPIALLQDLAVMANLGIEHVERNGHHYVRGLTHLPVDMQSLVAAKHPDLYETSHGFPSLRVKGGRIETGSVVDAPLGEAFDLDTARFTPVSEWEFDSMGLP